MIVDYYAVLSRAIASLEDNTVEARREVYARAQQMLEDHYAQMSPPSEAQWRAEQAAFADAVRRIEAEFGNEPVTAAGAADAPAEATRELLKAPPPARRFAVVAGIAAAVVVGLFAVGYGLSWSGLFTPGGEAPVDKVVSLPPQAPAPAEERIIDPDPGYDGGPSFAGLPFFYRRQPVYFRTTHPASTIVIDKSQHFLYLVQSSTVALRYGMAMGRECPAAHGLRQVAQKLEWPEWRASIAALSVRSIPAVMAGGAGNPLGARALNLDTEQDRIHGTNAPATIGRDMLFGCVRLANDDIVDLYKRVPVGSRVIITN